MKNFILIITLLIVTNLQLSAQWSNNPNNNLIVGYGLDPHICSDSAGGCYITYDYHSTSYPRWLAVERLDKYGFKPWGTNKRILGDSPEQTGAEIIEDGEGGVIVSYIDRYENLPYWTQRVRVQKVDSNGNFLWGPAGVKVTLDEINQGSQKIVNDGVGGAFVIWVNTQAQYKVNRISSDGQRMWGDSGIVAGINGWYDPALIVRTKSNKYVVSAERNTIKYFDENGNAFYNDSLDFWLFNIISDEIGGIVLSGKVWNGMIPKLVAQRRDSLGNNLWQEPYVEIADSLYINSSLSIKQNKINFYYGWTGKKNGIDKVAQFQALRLNGTKLFPGGSIEVGVPPLNGTIVQSLEENRTAFIYYSSDFLPDSLLVQTYDTLSNKLWNEDGILIAHPPIEYQSYTTDGNGGFIIGGVINNFTVVAQQVSKYGNLGEIITSVHQENQEILPTEIILYQNYPNPFNSSTVISYSNTHEGNISIKIYNSLGELIKIITNGLVRSGIHTVNLSSDDLPSGVYIYRLQTETKSLTKKLIIIK